MCCQKTMEEIEGKYTKDGTTDLQGNPAVKKETGKWKACFYILAFLFCERLAYYSFCTNLVNFMKTSFHQGNATAANSVTNWLGACHIMSLLGAFIADTCVRRYWILTTFIIIYITSMTLLTISAPVDGLRPFLDGANSLQLQRVFSIFVVTLNAVGVGGVSASMLHFLSDQFDGSDESEKAAVNLVSMGLCKLLMIVALIAASILVWIQMNVGWDLGYGIASLALVIGCVSFFLGSGSYRHRNPGGSPLTRIAQVIVASCRKFRVKVPADKSLLYEITDESEMLGSCKVEHTEHFKFFDKAAVKMQEDQIKGKLVDPWRLCTVTQVEELKVTVRILRILACSIIVHTVYAQTHTMFILQGNTLDPHMGANLKIPSASLFILNIIFYLVWRRFHPVIFPPVDKSTGRGIASLTQMGIGLVLSIFSMLAAGILEFMRLRMVKKDNLYDYGGYLPISIFWQEPQYLFVAFAYTFIIEGQCNFLREQVPYLMRSMLPPPLLFLVSTSGFYLSTMLVTVITNITTRHGKLGWIPDNLNRGHLDYYYWFLAILSFVNLGVYLLIAKCYTYKKEDKRDRQLMEKQSTTTSMEQIP